MKDVEIPNTASPELIDAITSKSDILEFMLGDKQDEIVIRGKDCHIKCDANLIKFKLILCTVYIKNQNCSCGDEQNKDKNEKRIKFLQNITELVDRKSYVKEIEKLKKELEYKNQQFEEIKKFLIQDQNIENEIKQLKKELDHANQKILESIDILKQEEQKRAVLEARLEEKIEALKVFIKFKSSARKHIAAYRQDIKNIRNQLEDHNVQIEKINHLIYLLQEEQNTIKEKISEKMELFTFSEYNLAF